MFNLIYVSNLDYISSIMNNIMSKMSSFFENSQIKALLAT